MADKVSGAPCGTGSHPSDQAPAGLGGARFDPSRVMERLGYFTGSGAEPTFDPGTNAPCPVCELPMGPLSPEATKCRSFRVCDQRSWFFYYHAACATEEGMKAVERFNDAAVDEAFAWTGLQ